MIRKIVFLIFFIAGVFVLNASAQTVDELVQKHIEAIGGYDAVKGVQTYKMTGHVIRGDMEIPFVVYRKKPGMFRREMTFQGRTMIFGSDGEESWSNRPEGQGGRGGRMGGRFGRGMMGMDVESPLVDYEKKGYKAELVGKESMEGTDVYKLKLTDTEGNVRYVFLDTEYFVILKETTIRDFQGQKVETNVYYSDYKEVGGLMIAHVMERKGDTPGGSRGGRGFGSSQTVIEKIEINVSLDEALFQKPKNER